MGKDLKGKELGRGNISESTESYSARFVDRFGKRKHKRSKSCKSESMDCRCDLCG